MKLQSMLLVLLCATAITQPPEDAKTADTILAIENRWMSSEATGGVGYVDSLLMPGYRSVGALGIVHSKADILADTARNGKSNAMKLKVDAFFKAHPIASSVAIQGDTAIVTFYSKRLGPTHGVTSSDTFVYVGGRWRALYSQHTSLDP
jgi:hypothetical protein